MTFKIEDITKANNILKNNNGEAIISNTKKYTEKQINEAWKRRKESRNIRS